MNAQLNAIAITGNIGSGKSTVVQYIASKGFFTLDADRLVSEVKRPGEPVYKKITQEFGEEILDDSGFISNQKLGSIVLKNPSKLLTLENIIHPAIWDRALQLSEEALSRHQKPKWFYEAALIFEKNLQKKFFQVWYIDCDALQRLQRTLQRPGMTEEKFNRLNDLQWSSERKKTLADYIIDNSKGLDKTKAQVDEILRNGEPV